MFFKKMKGRLVYAGLETEDGDLAVDVIYKRKRYGGYIPRIRRTK